MKKIILFMLVLLVMISYAYAAPFLLDSFEGDALDSVSVYYCGSYNPPAQPFNCSTAMLKGDTLEIEIYTADSTAELEADDLINVTIVAANSSGEPDNATRTIYAQNVTGGGWWNGTYDRQDWLDKNLTFILDESMPVGWYIMIFKCQTCDDGTTEKLGISIDTSSGYYGLPDYGYMDLKAGCNIWQGTETDFSTRTFTGFRAWGNFSTGTPIFEPPTPTDGSTNNTQVVINVSCEAGNISLWFDANADPITKVIDQTTSPNDYTTSVDSDGTYYYKASCNNGNSNTSVRSWTYDTTTPTITINSENFFNRDNYSLQNQYNNSVATNITISDANALYGFLINITKDGVEYFNYTNESLSGTSWDYTDTINTSAWGNGIYDISVTASDTHTTSMIKDYNIKKGNKYLEYQTEEGNFIRIETELTSSTNSVKKIDRYTFDFDFGVTLEKNKVFILKSDKPIRYIENSPYNAHFVVWNNEKKQGNWIDFEWNGKAIVEKLPDIKEFWIFGQTIYRYKITFNTAENKLSFNSIGGLNVNTEYFTWYRGIASMSESNNLTGQASVIKLNMTTESSIDGISAILSYNGTAYSNPSKTINSDNTVFEQSVTIQETESDLNLSYGWTVTVNQTDLNTTTFDLNTTHEVRIWGIDNCTLYNTYAINYTFVDEENSSTIPMDVAGTYYYASGGASSSFDLNMKDTTNFSICIYPSSETFIGNYSLEYSETEYPERRYYDNDMTLDNVGELFTLSSLHVADGMYIRFKTVDTYQNVISDVNGKMYKTDNLTKIIEAENTDDSGLATFWANPNQDYYFSFTKAGYTASTFTLRPTTSEIYTVTMTEEAAVSIDYTTGISYEFYPKDILLTNGTDYSFSFNLTSSYWGVTDCWFYLRDNYSNTLAQSNTGYDSSRCYIGIDMNTGKNKTITGLSIYELNSTINVSVYYTYSVSAYNYSDVGTLKILLDDITSFANSGFDDKTRFILAFILIFALTAFVSFKFGALTNPEWALFTLWVSTLVFSYIGWLTMDIPNMPEGISGLTNQYIIFILVTLLCGAYAAQRYR